MNLYTKNIKIKINLIKNLINSSLKRMPFHVLSFFCCFLLTVSCSKHREQYGHSEAKKQSSLLKSSTASSSEILLSSKGTLLNPPLSPQLIANRSNSKQNLQDIYRQIKITSSIPIDYESQSVGGININQKLKDVSFLNPKEIKENEDNMIEIIYKEGLRINVSKETEEINSIFISEDYKGSLDFGSELGQKRVGDSFANQFNLNYPIQKDVKNQNFIRSIYKHFEKTNEDCFSIKQCKSYFVEQIFVVELPKMKLFFTINERRTLLSLIFNKNTLKEEELQINYQNRSVGDKELGEKISSISINSDHTLDFGPQIGNRKVQDSFSDVFNLNFLHLEKDPEVQNFIISLYNHFEKTDINCLQEKLCHIENNQHLILKLPKMEFTFSKNNLVTLENITVIGEKMEQSLKNKRTPFNYEKGSIANINLHQKKEDVQNILSHDPNIPDDETFNIEGITVNFDENNEILNIVAFSNQFLIENLKQENKTLNDHNDLSYNGTFDFGSEIGHRKLGQSFVEQFNLNKTDPKQDEKAKYFITFIYNYWEKSNINCLETQDCEITVDENYIMFNLPKIILYFSNNYERTFDSISLKGLETQKREKQTKNIFKPINLLELSVGGINMDMTREEINRKLHIAHDFPNFSIYEEGLIIEWLNNKPNQIGIPHDLEDLKNIIKEYQGYILNKGVLNFKKLGDSFRNEFDFNSTKNIQEDEKAKNFINSIYNSLNNNQSNFSDSNNKNYDNCLELKKCNLKYTTDSKNEIMFEFSSFNLIFSNNHDKTLYNIILKNNP